MEFTPSLPTLFFLLNFYETLVCDKSVGLFFTKAHSVSAYLLREKLMELVALSV